jgi:hypothetical protein
MRLQQPIIYYIYSRLIDTELTVRRKLMTDPEKQSNKEPESKFKKELIGGIVFVLVLLFFAFIAES